MEWFLPSSLFLFCIPVSCIHWPPAKPPHRWVWPQGFSSFHPSTLTYFSTMFLWANFSTKKTSAHLVCSLEKHFHTISLRLDPLLPAFYPPTFCRLLPSYVCLCWFLPSAPLDPKFHGNWHYIHVGLHWVSVTWNSTQIADPSWNLGLQAPLSPVTVRAHLCRLNRN